MSNTLDLSTAEAVSRYLEGSESFASHLVTPLSGGFCNFTYRIHLRKPYENRPTLVLKYTSEYIASSATKIPLPTVRQVFEAEGLKLAMKLQPADSIVSPPQVHYFDEVSHVIIMEDCGEDSITLKQLMINETLPRTLADEIGAALGEFLGRIHDGNKSPNFDLGLLKDYQLGKAISGSLTYGCLISTITGKDNLSALSDPVLPIPQEKLDIISDLAPTKIDAINNASEIFTQGDFWPGNIMVSLDRDAAIPRLKRMYILDWEVAKAGLPGMDVGQMCAELYLLQRCYAHSAEPAAWVLKSFLEVYRRRCAVDVTTAQTAIVHVGAHLVAWTPRIAWGNKEKTRELVEEGIELLVAGSKSDEAWLGTSLIRPLLLVD
ncbi:hypothetical protein SERLA73DRAFT_191958 [Serpula lacrymans var. lacrymans S7.3]|uniref:Aminoglycoside phosphotransferase domain-containing protein n=2 Tax=Serpula lacrymans var. lacrymans TaxID=341189 RepID=F8QIP3_SERL3|nr:uncharacterized protein SERLADRAFT_473731 [Serpula lacrymans var. lacrymans S7.9]EGN91815.1 hypothetical protein SERLA73DRAFT_191958 [Serpula lacrymans var. lacrymans S7.3]EGO22629.1 hypothetical protein SERLADRAFT_473731 [Serpula lacrymans var. lacrymans S7.9]